MDAGPTEEPEATEELAPDLEAVAADYLAALPEGWGAIKVDALNEQLAEEEIFVVDVRQPDEYAGGSIRGAVNIPLRELGQALDQLPTEVPIVLVCGSGHRSAIGMATLKMVGFGDGTSLAGGGRLLPSRLEHRIILPLCTGTQGGCGVIYPTPCVI